MPEKLVRTSIRHVRRGKKARTNPPLPRRGFHVIAITREPVPSRHAMPARLPQARAMPSAGRSRRSRSEEHTSELQSLMRISYAVFCLKKKKEHTTKYKQKTTK